jgi:RNase adapter protein RapZ
MADAENDAMLAGHDPAQPMADAAAAAGQHVAIITGLSGAGKTATSKIFEDLGYTVVDNVPSPLLRDLAELVANDPARYDRVAIVLDVRQGDAPLALAAALGALHGRGIDPQILFLEASDDALVRRYSETRHRHPLDTQNDGVQSAIARERQLLDEIRDMAQTTIDTTDLAFKQLRERIVAALGAQPGPEQLSLQVISFGFKFGVPVEADLVFDVRFMENPFYRADLRESSGLSTPVREFVLGQPITQRFLEQLDDLFATLIPAYLAEGKTRLTIAIGCTGGFHRSVAIGEALATQLSELHMGPVMVWHRELEKRRP